MTEFKNKKVVLVAVPGAFTPTCQVAHIPSYTSNIDKLKAKGVDQIVVIASNDAFVMSAWGKANNVKDDFIVSVPSIVQLGHLSTDIKVLDLCLGRRDQVQQEHRLVRRRPHRPLCHRSRPRQGHLCGKGGCSQDHREVRWRGSPG